jgi:CRP-like cAMP-binding protein
MPLMILMHDVEHLRRMKSFMAPQAKKHARPFDVTPFLPLFDPGAQLLSFEPQRIERALLAARPPLFEQLSVLALRRVARSAYLLEVPAGGMVVRKGTAAREMYVVLEGELQVEDTGARIRRGEPMGEVAFLGTPGVRSATVHAVEPSRLLVLRRRFLDDLVEDDPRASYLIARNLARVVADRFAERIAP